MIQRALTQADVVVVAIDAPALIEMDGKYHKRINTPQVITDAIFRMLRVNKSRLIMLVPLKCEKYVSTSADAQRLAAKIEEAYRPLLNHLRSAEARSRVACVLTPVQTIGSVVFDRIEENEQDKDRPFEFVFRARSYGASYDPRDTDQPLRYALRFIVGKYRATAGPARAIYQRLMGTDDALVGAMQDFGALCKTTGGFSVLQDHHYLHSERLP